METLIQNQICHLCNSLSVNKKLLLRHQFDDHWEKCICPFCKQSVTFFTMESLEHHVKKEHDGCFILPQGDTLKCHICNAKFVTKINLQVHIECFHKITCGECNKSFSYNSHLKKHILKHHSIRLEVKNRRYKPIVTKVYAKCNQCGHTTYTRAAILSHFVQKHSGLELDVEFKCKDCEVYTKTEEDVGIHWDIAHRGGVFVAQFGRCNQCKYEVESKAGLLVHFGKMHPEEELDVEYKCRCCEEFFSTTDELGQHFKSFHRDCLTETVFKNLFERCELCELVSNSISNMECPKCGKFSKREPLETISIESENEDNNDENQSQSSSDKKSEESLEKLIKTEGDMEPVKLKTAT